MGWNLTQIPELQRQRAHVNARPVSSRGEHGGGVKGATSSALCCYPSGTHPLPPPRQSPCEDGANGTPLHQAPPIPAKQRSLRPCLGQSEATQTLGATPASAGRPIRADTNSGHAPVSESRALSAKRADGSIQTYRDGVESLGEAADLSIRAMYALVARCEELDRAMQPVPALAKRIRDMKGTLERLEGLCK
nr:LOW QUALITY PROTEIN: BLOC-1-related complex subunit 6 [Columba livia]